MAAQLIGGGEAQATGGAPVHGHQSNEAAAAAAAAGRRRCRCWWRFNERPRRLSDDGHQRIQRIVVITDAIAVF